MKKDGKNSEKSGCADPESFLKYAQGVFSYMYPLLAKQIITDYKITDGLGLNAGCGPGMLSIELAKRTNLDIIGVDISKKMCEIAQRMAEEQGVGDRFDVINGSVEDLPFADEKFDLIFSRGSFFFWEDKVQAFRELYRVLKTGGVLFIGAGDGRFWPKKPGDIIKKIKFDTIKRMKNRYFSPPGKFNFDKDFWRDILNKADIDYYSIKPHFLWIEIKK